MSGRNREVTLLEKAFSGHYPPIITRISQHESPNSKTISILMTDSWVNPFIDVRQICISYKRKVNVSGWLRMIDKIKSKREIENEILYSQSDVYLYILRGMREREKEKMNGGGSALKASATLEFARAKLTWQTTLSNKGWRDISRWICGCIVETIDGVWGWETWWKWRNENGREIQKRVDE